MSEFNKMSPGIYKTMSLEGLWLALADWNGGQRPSLDYVYFVGGVPNFYPTVVEFSRRDTNPSVGQMITVEPLTLDGKRSSACVYTFRGRNPYYFTAFSEDGLKDALHYYARGVQCKDVEFVLGLVSEIEFPSDFQITTTVEKGVRSYIVTRCAALGSSYLRIAKPEKIPGASFLGEDFYLIFTQQGIRSSYYHFYAHKNTSATCGPEDVEIKAFPMLIHYGKDVDGDFIHHSISLPSDFSDVLELMSTKIVNQSKA